MRKNINIPEKIAKDLKIKSKKQPRGGTRKNAGAKPKYSEPTTPIAFRCPVSKVAELKAVVKSKLSEWALNQS